MIGLIIFRLSSGSAKFAGAFFNAYFTRTITERLVDYIFIIIALSSLAQSLFYYALHKISDKELGKNKRNNIHLFIQSFIKLIEYFTQLNYGYRVSSIRNALCVESRTLVVFVSNLINTEKRKKISHKQYLGVFIIFVVIVLSSIFKDRDSSCKIKPKGFDSLSAVIGLLICGIFTGLLHVHFDETIKKSTYMEKEYGYKVGIILFLMSLALYFIQLICKKRSIMFEVMGVDIIKVVALFTLNNISAIFLMFYFSNLSRMILQQIIKLITTTSVDLLVQRGEGSVIFPYYGFSWICLSLVGVLFYNNFKFAKKY